MDESIEGEHASCQEEPVRLKEGGKIETWQAKTRQSKEEHTTREMPDVLIELGLRC
jgi:hypothetical protein